MKIRNYEDPKLKAGTELIYTKNRREYIVKLKEDTFIQNITENNRYDLIIKGKPVERKPQFPTVKRGQYVYVTDYHYDYLIAKVTKATYISYGPDSIPVFNGKVLYSKDKDIHKLCPEHGQMLDTPQLNIFRVFETREDLEKEIFCEVL